MIIPIFFYIFSSKVRLACDLIATDNYRIVIILLQTSLVPGASDALVYTTIGGAVGMLVPFISRDVSSKNDF